jgi:hypothetical protein
VLICCDDTWRKMQIAKGKTTMKIQRLSSLKDWFWITDLTNGLQPASSNFWVFCSDWPQTQTGDWSRDSQWSRLLWRYTLLRHWCHLKREYLVQSTHFNCVQTHSLKPI